MNSKQIEIADKVIQYLAAKSTNVHFGDISDFISKDFNIDKDQLFQICKILNEKKIVEHKFDDPGIPYLPTHSYSIKSLGYEVQEVGYKQWLKDEKEQKHLEKQTRVANYRNLKITRWVIVITLLITICNFFGIDYKFIFGNKSNKEARKEEVKNSTIGIEPDSSKNNDSISLIEKK